MVVTEFKVDLEEFRYLMRLELLREETRKAALHALIEEIVAYPDVIIEVKSWLIWPDGCWYYGRW